MTLGLSESDERVYRGYNGNSLIKRAGVKVHWTREMLEEYNRCAEDPDYFVSRYVKVIDVDRGLVAFEPRGYQSRMIQSFHKNRFTILATCRRAGKCVDGATEVTVRLFDSQPTRVRIVSLFEFFNTLNKHRTVLTESFVEEVLELVFQSNEKAKKEFIGAWRRSPHKASLTRRYRRQTKPREAYYERTLCSASSPKQDVHREQFSHEDELSLLWEEARSTPERILERTSLNRNKRKDKESVLSYVGDARASGKNRQDAEKEKSSRGEDEATTSRPREKRRAIEEAKRVLEDARSSHEGHDAFSTASRTPITESKRKEKDGGAQEEDWRRSQRKERLSRNETEDKQSGQESQGKVYLYRDQDEDVSSGQEKVGERESVECFFLEILTDSDFQPASFLYKTEPLQTLRIIAGEREITCASEHLLFNESGEVFARDLSIGDEVVTVDGLARVESIEEVHSRRLYDVSIEHPDHRFYSSGFLSHNSTAVCAYILHYILFNAQKTVALLANKGETARELLGLVQIAYQNLPKWLQQGVVAFNKGSFVLENGSRVIAAATSSDAIRGYSISLLYIDELAFIDNWEEFSASVLPTITTGKQTKIIFCSTPNGLNHFYDYWCEAVDGKNGFEPIMVKWREVPGFDDEWKDKTLGILNWDLQKFAQEYEVEFVGSSGTLILGGKLQLLREQVKRRDYVMGDGGLITYLLPEKESKYVIVADVGEGKGLDYTAAHVVDVTSLPYRQAATFRSNQITATDFAETIFRLAKAYNDAYVLVEHENLGPVVTEHLWNSLDYENVISTSAGGPSGKKVTFACGPGVDRGLKMTRSVKSIGCSLLKLLIEQDQLDISDAETVNELMTFSKQDSRGYRAEPGKHDDLVMALVVFAWLSSQHFFSSETSNETIGALRDRSNEEIDSFLVPFGFIHDGVEDAERRENPFPVAMSDRDLAAWALATELSE